MAFNNGSNADSQESRFGMTRRKLLQGGAAVTSAMALGGCLDLFEDEEYLTVTQQVEPLEWDPIVINDVYSSQITQNIYDGLYEYDTGVELVPKIADGQPQPNEDGTEWTIDIKEGVTFSNGDELTAEDVAHSFMAPIIEQTENITEVDAIESVDVLDDYTVQVNLEHPFAQFATVTVNRSIVNKSARLDAMGLSEDEYYEHDFVEDPVNLDSSYNTDEPIGSGPYEFVDWAEGEFVEIERRDDYWDEDAVGTPNIAEVVYEPVDEDTTRITRLEEESSEVIMGIPAHLWDDVQDIEHASIQEAESISYFYLAFNCNEGPTTQLEVREAIDMVFDMQAFIDEHVVPSGVRARTPLPPSIAEDWDFPVDQWTEDYEYDVDLDMAESLLDEHAPDDWEPLIIVPPDDLRELLGEVIQSGLNEIGYDATVQRIDWGPFTERYQSGDADEFNMYTLGWAGAGDPDVFMYPLFHEDSAGLNQGHFYDDEQWVHDNILEARRGTDLDERQQLYEEAIEQILADKVHLPAYSLKNTMGVHEDVEDVASHPASQLNPRIFSHYNNAQL